MHGADSGGVDKGDRGLVTICEKAECQEEATISVHLVDAEAEWSWMACARHAFEFSDWVAEQSALQNAEFGSVFLTS